MPTSPQAPPTAAPLEPEAVHSSSAATCMQPVRLDTGLELLLERAPPHDVRRVLATVIGTSGSTYRKPGARMLLLEDGARIGLLSGGCLENDLALRARSVFEHGRPETAEYDMREEDDWLFGVGAGCEGAMRMLLEPADEGSRAAAALRSAAARSASGEPAVVLVVHQSRQLPLGTYDPAMVPEPLQAAAARAYEERGSHELILDQGVERLRALVQFLAPPPHLLLCGAGPDAQPVCAAARALGWRVSVRDHRPAFARAESFPGARVQLIEAAALSGSVALETVHAAVVMSHHLESDVAYLEVLARAQAPQYVGLLGPPARRRRIVARLGASASQSLEARLHGPVGLDLGAQTPESIALAIVSEVHAWLAHGDRNIRRS